MTLGERCDEIDRLIGEALAENKAAHIAEMYPLGIVVEPEASAEPVAPTADRVAVSGLGRKVFSGFLPPHKPAA